MAYHSELYKQHIFFRGVSKIDSYDQLILSLCLLVLYTNTSKLRMQKNTNKDMRVLRTNLTKKFYTDRQSSKSFFRVRFRNLTQKSYSNNLTPIGTALVSYGQYSYPNQKILIENQFYRKITKFHFQQSTVDLSEQRCAAATGTRTP